MRLTSTLLPLPAPLLLLIATFQPSARAADELSPSQWPYNLPPHVKYWPEDPPHRRRDLEAIEQHLLAGRNPIGVKKMGDDEGEKFLVEYWNFGDQYSHFEDEYSNSYEDPTPSKLRSQFEEDSLYLNESIPFQHPFALHKSEQTDTDSHQAFYKRNALSALFSRNSQAFTCPSGTLACSNINQPNACCASDETCFVITDTGLGDVGCCPSGETCTGQEISCPANYESCPDETGGGCCIPGYVCDGPGCVPSQSVVTVVTTITVIAATGTIVETFTTAIPGTSISVGVSVTVSETASAVQTTLACATSYFACPINQGGGCCPTGRECGLNDCPTSGSVTTLAFTTATGVIPDRPNSSNTITVFPSTGTITAVATGNTCPVGFYGCSAVHQGGCCRTGRNCDTTDCPSTKSTTIISEGATIVVPVGTAAAVSTASVATQGNCAVGWFNCAGVLGGGCCPNGYDCGTASCSLFSGSMTVEVGPKETAVIYTNGVGRSRRIGMKGWLGGVFAICWIGGVVMILMIMWF